MASPTNADILALIKQNHDEVASRLDAVEDQVRLTNGRVKDLERAEIGRKAIAEYQAGLTQKKQFDITTVILFLSMLAMFVGALWWLKG